MAKNSQLISAPTEIRRMNLTNTKILDLVKEGTVVDSGAYIGQLDRTEVLGKILESELNVQKYSSELEREKLDSTLTLAQAREDLVNLKFGLEEKKLGKEQSAYEPPAKQRQAEIEYEKASRALSQSTENYDVKVRQASAKMRIAQSELNKAQNSLEDLRTLSGKFKITATTNGMVLYSRDWNGRKRVVGSVLNGWDLRIAELPDFSVLESVTKVNEVDIRKVKADQIVEISLDADPSKKFKGKVTDVANVGSSQEGSNSKFFEVRILFEEKDSSLLPAMTTSNVIHISSIENALFIPLECIHPVDSISVVYKKSGGGAIRQQVKLGLINENEAVIEAGLKAEDEIFLSLPDNPDKLELKLLIH